ncbi:MAG TPA: YchJ family metal-binding protein [Burkholderiaceae bacterium]|nr:YchJ family metal-binding protein [Burkholderiaceae bacterium]
MKKTANFSLLAPCSCGSTAGYEACCGRWHHGMQRLMAPDAQTLMRSRYTAFVLDELDYLLETWHASTRPASLERNAPGVKWLGLQLHSHARQDANHATVEFVARSRHNGQAVRLHEISRFVREDGRWFYVDGDFVQKPR